MKMVESNFFNLYYYASQALLGYITSNMRGIAVAYDDKFKNILVHVYLLDTPSEIDKENMYSAFSEAESHFDKSFDYKIEFIIKKDKFSEKDKLDVWLFMRYPD
jgi:hypothetical protein